MTEPSSAVRSSRTVYRTKAKARHSRGRVSWLIGLALLVAALGAVVAWQVITAPCIEAISPQAGAHTMHSTITLRVTIRGIQKLRDVRAHIDDQDVSASVTIDGDHVVIPGERLTDGQHTVAMAASTGNLYRRRLDRTWQFTVDTKPPSLTVKTPAKETVFTMTPITISGTAEAAATISVEDIEGSTVATPDGSYSLTVTPPDGKLTLTIQARDRAGNTSTIERRIVVDTTAPSLWVEAMGTVRTATPQLSVNVNDAACTPRLKVTVDGKPVYAKRKTGSRLVELGELAEGTHAIVLRAIDDVGHQETKSLTILVDSSETLGEATLMEGAVGKDVEQLQKLLKQNGVYSQSLTGVYDAATIKAVRKFQQKTNQPVDGIAGPIVLASLTGRIVIDQSELRLYFYLHGKLKLTYRVATGMPAYPTPNGSFRVVVMAKNPTWIPPDSPWAKGLEPIPPGDGNPLGTRWIGLSAPGVGIHGTNADWSIGSYASHGCVRMHIWEVEELFEYVKVGMPVVIRW